MRVISGRFRGKKLKSLPGDNTRPTTDQVKESIFNMIGPYFEGDVVLDLFAGSGALSIEAISRGCDEATLVDASPEAIKVISENIASVSIEKQCKILRMDYKLALNQLSNESYDLVFLDPPYHMHLLKEIIDFLLERGMLNRYALIICEYDKENELEGITLPVFKENDYGKTRIKIFEYGDENE